ncbi:MAG TPA: DUF1214 domain-containing protein [Rhizomicrobium sp.]|nr:DUF1214 domain-containing protein [Rhizomicrobium sp.]
MQFTRRTATLAGLSAFAGALVPGIARAQRSDWWMRDMNGWMLDTQRGLYGTLESAKKTIRLVSTKDSQGNAFDGTARYLIRFPRGQMPPVSGFWSLTVHDDSGGNSIGSQNALIVRPNGTVDIFVQGYPPPVLPGVNWLAWNGGPFRLSLLMNRPSETDPSIFTGSWTPPPVGRIAYAYKYNPNGRG